MSIVSYYPLASFCADIEALEMKFASLKCHRSIPELSELTHQNFPLLCTLNKRTRKQTNQTVHKFLVSKAEANWNLSVLSTVHRFKCDHIMLSQQFVWITGHLLFEYLALARIWLEMVNACDLACLFRYSSDVGRPKLLSGSASCDLCKSPISILQKKAIGELYRVIPFSSCAFNVCGSYAHFNFFPYKLPLNKNVNALRLYCTDS